MTRKEIVEALARKEEVERIVCRVARRPLDDDLRDLAQMVYLVLLTYDEDKIVDLYESDALRFFIVRVASNQYWSNHSAFHKAFRRERQHLPITNDILEDTPDE